LKLAQYCGVVNLGARVLEVLPKTQDRQRPAEACRGVLLRLLRLSGRFPHFRHLPAGHHLRRGPLLEAFIAAFFEALGGVVRGGLLRQYLEHEDDLGLVRGRIATARQLGTQANRKDVVACVFDELSADNIWNRVLKKALRATRPWLHAPQLGRRWIELMGILDPVDDAHLTHAEIDRLVFDRPAQRYRDAIGWARWILALLAPALRAGADDAPALLFDMNKLFEDFVTVALREACRGLGLSARLQDPHHLDEASAIRMKPDFVLYGPHGTPCAVVDAKYKAEKREGFPDADLYQMLAYCTALGLHEGHLVYAKGNAPHAAHVVRHAGIVIHQHALDLDQEPSGLLSDVAKVASRLVNTPRV